MIETSLVENNASSSSAVENIILALDGESIILKNPVISAEYDLQEEDQSGQSSSSNKSEQGIKAKKINVSGLIEYSKSDRLSRLIELSYQTESGGTKKLYRIANATANVINLRQAVFSGKVSIAPHASLLAWQIGFTLSERNSVPEKREARSQEQAKENGTQTVNAVDDKAPSTEAEEKEELTGFEQFLSVVNDNLP